MIELVQGSVTAPIERLILSSAFTITQDPANNYHLKLDTSAAFGITEEQADIRYVLKTGDTMTGNLTTSGIFRSTQTNGWVLGAFSGVQRIQWNTDHFTFLNASNALAPLESGPVTADTNAYIGQVGHAGYGGFSHPSMATTTGYAIIQNGSGDTLVNAASGRALQFRINNTAKWGVDATRLYWVPGGGSQTDAPLGVRGSDSNGIEFGHSNTSGYGSTIGHERSSGYPFVAFYAEAGTTSNTYRTRGNYGVVMRANTSGGWELVRIPSVNADNQSPVVQATIDASAILYTGGGAQFTTLASALRLGSYFYISPTNHNTFNSGYANDAEDYDIWFNYRGYNDGFTRFRDLYIANGKGTAFFFADGSSQRVHIGDTAAPSYRLQVAGDVYATGGWFRVQDDYGLYSQTNDTRLYSSVPSYWENQAGSGSTAGGFVFRNPSSTVQGYVYWDTNGFGLLTAGGSWSVRITSGGQFFGGYQGVNESDYGYGLVGVYDPTKYRLIYAMGAAYIPATNGSGLGTLYGIGYVYDNTDTGSGYKNVSGRSFGHSLFQADNGTINNLIGSNGIWSRYNIVAEGNMYADDLIFN